MEDRITSKQVLTAERYGARAGEFIRSASVLCRDTQDSWLAPTGLLLGFACELLAKRRLVLDGVPEDALRKKPFGHDIAGMWRDKTKLYSEAESLVLELKQNPNSNGVNESFDWELHFNQLARAHSSSSDYSLRYHHGEKHFADPKALTVVLWNIWLAEEKRAINDR
jgi:hypothetical protein